MIAKGMFNFDDLRNNKYFVNPVTDGYGHFDEEEWQTKQFSAVLSNDLQLGWYLSDPHNNKVKDAQDSSIVALLILVIVTSVIFILIATAHFLDFIKIIIAESNIRK